MRLRTIGVAVSVALIWPVGQVIAAGDATATKINALAPKEGASIHKGSALTFKVGLVPPPGAKTTFRVFLRVSSSRRTKNGLLRTDKRSLKYINSMTSTGKTTFAVTPRLYKYLDYWLNKPGTYYWQAYYVYCQDTCYHPGALHKLRVTA